MLHPARIACIAPLLLTLATACDVDPQDLDDLDNLDNLEEDSSDDDLRSLTIYTFGHYYNNPKSGMRLNTNNIGGWPFSEFLLDGSMHNNLALLSVETGPFAGNRPAWEHDDVYAHEPIERVGGVLDLQVNAHHMLTGTTTHGQPLQHGDFHNSIWTVQLDPQFVQDLDAAGIHHDGYGRVDLLLEVDWLMPEGIGEFDPMMIDEDDDERALSEFGAVPIYTFRYGQNSELVSTCSIQTEPSQMSTAAVLYRDAAVDDYDGSVSNQADTLQIACLDGAVGKVAGKWDYWPDPMDPSAVHDGDARSEFELSVRVVRADYCGDGTAWTVAGQPLEVYDTYPHTAAWDWALDGGFYRPKIEAVWGDGGAQCIDVHRLSGPTPNCGIPACGGKYAAFGHFNYLFTPSRFVTRNHRQWEINLP